MILSNSDLVMHKLKGKHKFRSTEVTEIETGRRVVSQTCKVCGFKNKLITDANYGFRGGSGGVATASYSFYTNTSSNLGVSSTIPKVPQSPKNWWSKFKPW